jgi:hypothetical protein
MAMKLDRLKLIQSFIDKERYKSYLEIGVFKGDVFFNVKCKNKIAVDPKFRFKRIARLNKVLNNFSNLNAKYFEMTSDSFFENKSRLLTKHKIDICFVDGMHEFDFALNDVLNAIQYLSDNGMVIMHDCNPITREASVSFKEYIERGDFSKPWNGDVWKVIIYLRSFRNDLNVFVVDCDCGLGIIKKSSSINKGLNFKTKDEIEALTYDDFENNRREFLDLKEEGFMQDFFVY